MAFLALLRLQGVYQLRLGRGLFPGIMPGPVVKPGGGFSLARGYGIISGGFMEQRGLSKCLIIGYVLGNVDGLYKHC